MKSLIFLMLLFGLCLHAQTTFITVKDADTQLAVKNATIQLLNQSYITDDNGFFSIDFTQCSNSDTIKISHISYQQKEVTVGLLKLQPQVYVSPLITSLENVILYAHPPKAKQLVERVLLYKDKNYKLPTVKREITIERSSAMDVETIDFDVEKNSTHFIKSEALKNIKNDFPKHTEHGNLIQSIFYKSANPKDSIKFKLGPTTIVNTREKNYDMMELMEKKFEEQFRNLEKGMYWKIKTGIIGKKIAKPNTNKNKPTLDSITKAKRKIKRIKQNVKWILWMAHLNNKKMWKFLYKTNRYRYEFSGGVLFQDREVFVVDFYPKRKGKYEGRLFIDKETNALVKASFAYAPKKHGASFNLLGVKFKEYLFKKEVLFKKHDEFYALQHVTVTKGNKQAVNRKGSLIKKKKRVLFDKTLAEIKLDVNYAAKNIFKTEVRVTNLQPIKNGNYQLIKENINNIDIKNLVK